jgi:hypothetical protein
VQVLGFWLMSDHFHLVLIPRRNRDLAAYLSWITNAHVIRSSPCTSTRTRAGAFRLGRRGFGRFG